MTASGPSSSRRVVGQRWNWRPAKTRTTTRSRTTTRRRRTTTRTADVTRRPGSSGEARPSPLAAHAAARANEIYGGTREMMQETTVVGCSAAGHLVEEANDPGQPPVGADGRYIEHQRSE